LKIENEIAVSPAGGEQSYDHNNFRPLNPSSRKRAKLSKVPDLPKSSEVSDEGGGWNKST
jgi:hypothetical protein